MLKFIGTGSAFNTDLVNTSAYIKDGENILIIDCGETAFARMKQLNLFEDVKNVYIAITHMHSDHVGSLGSLIEYLGIFYSIVPNILITNEDSAEKQEDNIRKYLELVGITEEEYDFTYCDMMEDAIADLKKIEMVEVEHSKQLTSYAVELYFNNKTIYYTGDQNDKKYVKLIAKNLKPQDLVYVDCTNKDYKGRVHINLDELSEIFDKHQRAQVYCMHFENMGVIADAKELGFKTATRELSIEDLLRQIANRK